MQGKVQSERKKGKVASKGKGKAILLLGYLMGRFYLRPKIRKVARRSCSENIDIGAEGQSTDLAGP